MNDSVKCAAAYEIISFEPLKQVLRTLLGFSLFYFTLSVCFRFSSPFSLFYSGSERARSATPVGSGANSISRHLGPAKTVCLL